MLSCSKRRELFIDIETYSSVDIRRAGLYPYVASDDFAVLLIAYAWGDEPVQVIDMMDELKRDWTDLGEVYDGLRDPNVVKIAHNAAFERTALSPLVEAYLPADEWQDTMILAAVNGLPMSLEAAGAALQIEQQKLKEGAALINYFCKPCKPTIANGGRTRNWPHHAPDKWARFKEYNAMDVEAERQIYRRLQRTKVTDFERKVWSLDARINERGVLVDTELAEAAIAVDAHLSKAHADEMQQLTGLDNPNSVAQLKDWLATRGVSVDSLDKAATADLLDTVTDPTTRRVLQLRRLMGKTSVKKYEAMLTAKGPDDRVRGLLQYYGAGRTGRWAGRLVQVQNLPQNHLADIGEVRKLVRERDIETLSLCYASVPDVLSQLIRTAFIAKPGHTFLVADYAAIEARVIAWMAGVKWRMDVFANGGDIYCSSASQMFKVPVEKHGINGHLRQKGKVAELACGYGGGVKALKAFGADRMGLSEEEMQTIVSQWRQASPQIPLFWRGAEAAARAALTTPGKVYRVPSCNVTYHRDADALRCTLPSGRVLSYWNAWQEDGGIFFMGQSQTTRTWEKTGTWGGKLVENIVQAVARDCLAEALVKLDAAGYGIAFHVHDEVVIEAPEGSCWQDVAAVMAEPISWAPGLLLRGDGYCTPYYLKD